MHQLNFEVPTARDYINGGFGDLVAQCSCGTFEYVYSKREGAYWHHLHIEQPTKHAQFLLVDYPMPENWERPLAAGPKPAATARRRGYTCPACGGARTLEACGPHNGRFYHLGERRGCTECAGSGVTDRWIA